MNNIPVTIVGNLTADPELRFTPSGAAVTKLTIAQTPRVRKGDVWEDGTSTFLACTLWRHLAENAAESLSKGSRVIAAGSLRTEAWETPEGEKRSRIVLDVTAIGPDLSYATATVRKMVRTNTGPNDDEWSNASTERPA